MRLSKTATGLHDRAKGFLAESQTGHYLLSIVNNERRWSSVSFQALSPR